MKLKAPEILARLSASLKRKRAKPRPHQALRAATASRRMSPAMDDDMDDEPTTRLSSAFFVVLILHLVAVGGIWAFNSIKAHRRGGESSGATTTQSAAAQPAPDATMKAAAPSAPAPEATKPQVTQSASIAPAAAPTGTYYEVKANDTLTKIAGLLHVSVADIQAVNNAKDIAVLKPGQVINVPGKKAADKPVATSTQKKPESTPVKSVAVRTYEVKKGDTATSIAKRYGMTTEALMELNKIKDPKKLQLGQSLKVPVK